MHIYMHPPQKKNGIYLSQLVSNVHPKAKCHEPQDFDEISNPDFENPNLLLAPHKDKEMQNTRKHRGNKFF